MSRSAARTPSPPTDGQLCTLFAVDIAGFTSPGRDDEIRLYLHEELYEVLEKAFDGSGIPWASCFHEDRGDGALIVVPPGVACKGIIDPLPERLRGLIRRHNHVSCQAAGIQLRAAAHIGPVEHDGHGFVGSDINLLFRMLEARPLKRALAGSGAELALIVSDDVYRRLVCRCPSLVSPDAFQRVRFQVKYARAGRVDVSARRSVAVIAACAARPADPLGRPGPWHRLAVVGAVGWLLVGLATSSRGVLVAAGHDVRIQASVIGLRVPRAVITAKTAPYLTHGKPWHRPELMNLDDPGARPVRTGGRRKRTRTTGTSPAAYRCSRSRSGPRETSRGPARPRSSSSGRFTGCSRRWPGSCAAGA